MKVAIVYGTPQQCSAFDWDSISRRNMFDDEDPYAHAHIAILTQENVRDAIHYFATYGAKNLVISTDDQRITAYKLVGIKGREPEIFAFRSLNNIYVRVDLGEVMKVMRNTEHRMLHLMHGDPGSAHMNAITENTLLNIGQYGGLLAQDLFAS